MQNIINKYSNLILNKPLVNIVVRDTHSVIMNNIKLELLDISFKLCVDKQLRDFNYLVDVRLLSHIHTHFNDVKKLLQNPIIWLAWKSTFAINTNNRHPTNLLKSCSSLSSACFVFNTVIFFSLF